MREHYKKCELGNDLEFSDKLINEMLLILIEEATDDFWKILKYPKSDALSNPSYTVSTQDKYDLVKQNNVIDGNEITRIKVMKFNDDISATAHSEIRIFNASWDIRSTNDYVVGIGVEIICNNSLVILDVVGKTSLNVLRHEIYRIFNNSYVYKNIGKMTNVGTRGSITLFNKDYQGYQLTLVSMSG